MNGLTPADLSPGYTYRSQLVDLGLTPQQILPSNIRRQALYFSNPELVTNIWVAPFTITVANEGLMIPPASLPLVFTVNVDGNLPTLEWWANTGGVLAQLWVLEVEFNPRAVSRLPE